jgi:hypothetical protein
LELDDEKFESSEEDEVEEEEPHTPVLRISVRERRQLERYSPPDSVPIFIYLLLMMILELSGKQ